MPDDYSCNATERVRSRMMICERPLHHPERTHKDGDHEWAVESSSYTGESTVEAEKK